MKRLEMDIEALIPHRGPIRLIEGVLAVDAGRAVTVAVAKPSWPLARRGDVDPLVAIELVAQTAALMEGWTRRQEGGGGAEGWLVGIKHAEFGRDGLPFAAELTTEVLRSYALEGYAVFAGTVRMGEEVVAALSIQAFRMDAAA